MSTATVWVVWLFLAIGALGWALFVLLDSFDAKKDAAAWVQAFGSIAAIVGAFLVAQRTHQLERKAKAEESTQLEVDALHFAENAAYEAYSSVHQAAGLAESAPYMIDLGRLEEVRHTLRSLLNRPLPTHVFSSIFIVQAQVSEALSAAERVKKGFAASGYLRENDIQELEYRRSKLSDARKVIAGLYWNKAALAGVAYSRRPEDQEQETATDIVEP
ncbi:hypothetical protein GXB78_24185 [Pseudomonas moraviensis subsp. stanleyae]|uniref:hypothetical protein n=1 Tax=Pseudomonas moraviensis TaxID=321662 RepID=UPI002E3450B3|nr:hypothetical protein [Pseudomonas moraviensis]MED7670309.1 hypothetical protein [Pseudomonas moraviensis subsp. stanleyae]